MADYTYSEIMKMQNDAIKRVEDMQKKARKTAGLEKEKEENEKPLKNIPSQEPRRVPMPNDYLEKLKNYASNSSYTGDEEHTEEKTEEEKPKNHDKRKQNVFFEKTENTFGDLNIDEDKALLLALIMLLSEEKGDELLIMALIYMLT